MESVRQTAILFRSRVARLWRDEAVLQLQGSPVETTPGTCLKSWGTKDYFTGNEAGCSTALHVAVLIPATPGYE